MMLHNALIFVLDSCRYDTFCHGCAKELLAYCVPRKAYAPATWTLPSHMSMAMGFFPETIEAIPYYNRFARQLFRFRADTYLSAKARQARFIVDGSSIFEGVAENGYATRASVAVSWLRRPCFARMFGQFEYLEQIEEQIQGLRQWTAETPKHVALVNCGETHFPYDSPASNIELPAGIGDAVAWLKPGLHVLGRWMPQLSRLKDRQTEAAHYVTGQIARFLATVGHGTTVMITSDHGECFGEDGLFGHGFYHPAVMEVPLMIFET
jgi:hypothetical protein